VSAMIQGLMGLRGHAGLRSGAILDSGSTANPDSGASRTLDSATDDPLVSVRCDGRFDGEE
jgi:hypothetical protein